jgi:hypothetical protein
MPDLIDFDTGPIITGAKTAEQMGEDMLELVLATASGDYTPKAVSFAKDFVFGNFAVVSAHSECRCVACDESKLVILLLAAAVAGNADLSRDKLPI